jgi:two-component system, LytTR family, sensor kinase
MNMSKVADGRRWIKWSLICGCWTVAALFFTTQAILQNSYAGTPPQWRRVLAWELVYFYLWLILTPAVLRLSRRFRFERGRRLRALAAHSLASLALSLSQLALYSSVYQLLHPHGLETPFVTFIEIYKNVFAAYIHFCLLSYWGVLIVDFAVKYYRAYQERALRASQLETSLARAQLQALQMQLQPHFLFNTLNTISELVHEDSEAADRMIARLSGLLRSSLETVGAQEVTLKQELEFLQKYLDIEQMRLGERLTVRVNVAPETLDARVPNMILQPLVENAIRHAITPRAEGGSIEVRAGRRDTKLCVSVCDDGRNSATEGQATFREGVGLSNTRARLKHLYGAEHRFDLHASGGGLIVSIELPFTENTNRGVS